MYLNTNNNNGFVNVATILLTIRDFGSISNWTISNINNEQGILSSTILANGDWLNYDINTRSYLVYSNGNLKNTLRIARPQNLPALCIINNTLPINNIPLAQNISINPIQDKSYNKKDEDITPILLQLPGCGGSSNQYVYVLFTSGFAEFGGFEKIIKGQSENTCNYTAHDFIENRWRDRQGVESNMISGSLYGTWGLQTEIIINFKVTNKYTGKSQFIRVYHSSYNYNLGVSIIPNIDFDDYGQPDYSNFKIFPATSSSTPGVVVIGPPL